MSRIPQDKLNDLEKKIIFLVWYCRNHMIYASQLFVLLSFFETTNLYGIAKVELEATLEAILRKVTRNNSDAPHLPEHLHAVHGMKYNGLLTLMDHGTEVSEIRSHRYSETYIHLTPTAKAYSANLAEGRDPALWYPSRKIFIACSFGKESRDVQRLVDNQFLPTIEQHNFEPLIMNSVSAQMSIDEDLIKHIRTSHAMIADLTYARPSVYFEVGFAKAIGLPTILTCRYDHKNGMEDAIKIHFDLEHHTLSLWEETAPTEFIWHHMDFDNNFKNALGIPS